MFTCQILLSTGPLRGPLDGMQRCNWNFRHAGLQSVTLAFLEFLWIACNVDILEQLGSNKDNRQANETHGGSRKDRAMKEEEFFTSRHRQIALREWREWIELLSLVHPIVDCVVDLVIPLSHLGAQVSRLQVKAGIDSKVVEGRVEDADDVSTLVVDNGADIRTCTQQRGREGERK